ncbi:MAG: hypothetical protein Q7U04_03985 [Bacteriovorax sp.]|nr:hypothetical protein [Bacteriovorax sp.]
MIDKKIFIHWLCAFFLASFVLSSGHFKSESNDSKYYTDLVVRYQNQDWQSIISPKWGVNYWGFEPSSYMRDQFPGQLILGVSMSKIGIPAEQSLHILEMAFQILSIFLLVNISLQFISYEYASALFYGLLLTPLAFSYNIRANHELGIMFFSFLALYSGLKLSKNGLWGLIVAISCTMLLMIKGPFFIFGFALSFIGYLFSKEKPKFLSMALTLFFSAVCIVAVTYTYEILFKNVTGESFIAEFYKIQFQQRAMLTSYAHTMLVQKILNLYYYVWHYVVYSLIWSLFVLLIVLKNIKKIDFQEKLKKFLKSPLSKCLLSSAFVFCFLFSLSDRTASRYVFPAYYLFSAWNILLLLHLSENFKKIQAQVISVGLQFLAPLLWLFNFALHFFKF